MGLKEVWGFDPDEAARAQNLFRGKTKIGVDQSSDCAAEDRAVHIPPDAESQVYELRRIFRL